MSTRMSMNTSTTLRNMLNMAPESSGHRLDTQASYAPGNEEYDRDVKDQNVGLPKLASVKLFAAAVLLFALALTMVRAWVGGWVRDDEVSSSPPRGGAASSSSLPFPSPPLLPCEEEPVLRVALVFFNAALSFFARLTIRFV